MEEWARLRGDEIVDVNFRLAAFRVEAVRGRNFLEDALLKSRYADNVSDEPEGSRSAVRVEAIRI